MNVIDQKPLGISREEIIIPEKEVVHGEEDELQPSGLSEKGL